MLVNAPDDDGDYDYDGSGGSDAENSEQQRSSYLCMYDAAFLLCAGTSSALVA
jgi:hypothetical protein